MTEEQRGGRDEPRAVPTGPPDQPEQPTHDEFEGLVLDDEFVRGGSYEAPARTRLAIARYGGRRTSWRHGGGLDAPRERRGSTAKAVAARPARANPRLHRLPLVVAIAVVAIAAVYMFR